MIKNCAICGEAFEARKKTDLTCGPEHRAARRAEMANQWQRENGREYARRWRVENPERAREISRLSAEKNRGKNKEYARRLRRENPQKHRDGVLRSSRKQKDLKTLSNLLAMQAGFTVENHHV